MDIFRPGETCWRIAQARRVAFLVDTQAYFTAAYEAMLNARRSIMLLGWGFDPRSRLAPDGGNVTGEPDEAGRVLLHIARERPEVDIRLLIWKSALPISATQEFFPHRARDWFKGSSIRFELDDAVPLGACHHQKVLVIDDAVAFVGGGDICSDRWDSTAHLDRDLRRRLAHRVCHSPRHEVMMMVDGEAAAALGQLARDRWKRSLGETMAPPPDPPLVDPWPAFVAPEIRDAPVAIGRTLPAWRDEAAASEILQMTLASIAGAKRSIYIENQYFTSAPVAEALAARLAEPNGPEIVVVTTHHSPSWFDQLTMDRVRGVLIRRLREADIFGRFAAYSPTTPGGKPIIVHSKVTIIDDELARVGSANINNRSGGFDTECELAVAATTDEHRQAIAAFRDHLISHYVARKAADVAKAGGGSLIRALEELNRHSGRLKVLRSEPLGKAAKLIADFHLGDPTGPDDAMRPYKRRRLLNRQVRTIAAESGMWRFIRSLQSRLRGEDDPTPPG